MTAPASPPSSAAERLAVAVFVLIILLSVVLVAVTNPGLVRFWPMSAGEFLQTIAPLFLVSLFIERVLEVFLTIWRGPAAAEHSLAAKKARLAATGASEPQPGPLPEERTLVAYKASTQRIAFLAGIALGIVISALGVRALGLFVDPAVFRDLERGHPVQADWFNAADVFLTGAVLGGGSDGLHKLVSVFTSFLDATARRAKGAGPVI